MNELQELVYKNDKGIFCDSRMIAEKFEKNHADVLKAIDNLLKELEKVSDSNFTVAEIEHLFIKTTYQDKQNKTRKCYEMNREAFSLLVMGFTGFKALQWQIKFNDAFYRMETKIKELQPKIPQTFSEALRSLADETDKNIQLQIENKNKEKKIKKDKPKVEFFNQVADTSFLIDMIVTSSKLGHGRNTFMKMLREDKILMSDNLHKNIAYRKFINLKYFKTKTVICDDGEVRPQTFVTEKGFIWLQKKYSIKPNSLVDLFDDIIEEINGYN